MKNQYKRTQASIFSEEIYDPKQPRTVSPKPTEQDYQRGYMTRYFLKRRHPAKRLPFEVDERQYQSWALRGRGISQKEYQAIVVKWRIRGSVEPVDNDLGYPIERGVRETNKRLIERVYEPEMSGISRVLGNNLLQYHNNSFSPNGNP